MALIPLGDTVRLNNKVFSRNSVQVLLNGVLPIQAVDSMSWDHSREMSYVNGLNQGGSPLGLAVGNWDGSASITILTDYAGLFETALLASPSIPPEDPSDLTQLQFSLIVSYREDVRVRMIEILNCRIKGMPGGGIANDGSASVTQYDLMPMEIRVDGKMLGRTLPTF